MMENPRVASWNEHCEVPRRDVVPMCSEDSIKERIENIDVCESTYNEPLKGRIYYHPVDDDPQFLGCTRLILPVERVRPIIPEPNLVASNEPMENMTTFKRAFGKAPPLGIQTERIRQKYERPSEPVATDTEYRGNYCAKPIEPAKIIIPESLKPLGGSMEKISTYTRTFRAYNEDEMKHSKPNNYSPKRTIPDRTEFIGRSTTKETYTAHFGVIRPDVIKPLKSDLYSGKEMNFETTQRREFTPKCVKKTLPTIYKSDPYLIRPENADVSTPISSMQRAFVPFYDVIPVCSMKPKRVPAQTDLPMSFCTSYTNDYWQRKPEKQYSRPEWSKRKPYSVPSKEMDKDTTYNTQYKKHLATTKTKSFKPERVFLQFGPCDVDQKQTTTQSQYRSPPKGDFKGKNYMPERKYKKSDDHVDYITTTQGAYRGVTAPKRMPFAVSREAELQQRYQDKRMANRSLYREMFGVNFVFVPPKSLISRRKDPCMYDTIGIKPENSNHCVNNDIEPVMSDHCLNIDIPPVNSNQCLNPVVQQVKVA